MVIFDVRFQRHILLRLESLSTQELTLSARGRQNLPPVDVRFWRSRTERIKIFLIVVEP